MAKERLTPNRPAVEDQLDRLWSDPEALQDACIAALDQMLEHDVERLAAVSGICRRELNKQRERRADKLKKQWLHRLCDIARATSRKFGPDRTAAAARLFAYACGHRLASTVPVGGAIGVDPVTTLAAAIQEFGEICVGVTAAHASGKEIDRVEAKQLIPEVDEGLEQMQALRNQLAAIAAGNTNR